MVLWSQGATKVLCTASVVENVPRWLYRSGRGWVTAEYSLLPASTGERTDREAARGKQGGRTVEIQRLIGRAVRGVIDFEALGERTVHLDCDVLQADGGTRCAAICGAYVALCRALDRFGLSKALVGSVAAVSVGVVEGEPLLDLEYTEDSTADVDLNVVMTGEGLFVEVQATAERVPFDRARLDELLDLAAAGIEDLAAVQREAIDATRGMKAVLASQNLHKLEELRDALPDWQIDALDADGYPEETGETYYENALLKARFGRGLADPDAWVLGEDSGIECAALDGAPGLHSARWAPGLDQADALLARLEGETDRRARMVTELVALSPAGEELRGRGVLEGELATERRGDGGFGYDPIFIPSGRYADGRRDRGRVEAPELAPRSRRTGAAGGDW